MKAIVLGCGTSSGVPRIGNDWGVCDPLNPKNRRTRASVLIEADGYRILVDTGPDMRQQLLAADIGSVDAVIYTHDHADHCHGIDDLRQIYHQRGRPVDIYARPFTLQSLSTRFIYAFEGKDGYPPLVKACVLDDEMALGPIRVRVVDQPHGSITSAGLRFDYKGKSIAYSTDLNELTDTARILFAAVDLWIVDALRRRPHPTHPHLAQTLEWIEQVGPELSVLTHMDQSMDYASLLAELPTAVVPGYDNMVIELK